MSKLTNSEKMKNMPMDKLLLTMSLPAMFSMLVQSLYNIVDSIFVSTIGEHAITAVSIAFPLQMVLSTTAMGLAVAVNSLVSRKLGSKEVEDASQIAKTGLCISMISAIIFMIIGLTVSESFVKLFTTSQDVVDMGSSYLLVVMTMSFGLFIEATSSRILQATGNMKIPMISQIIGSVVNIILNPIMIFGLFGFPELGVKGAAIATVTGQIVAMIYVLSMFKLRKQEINISLKGFKINKSYIGDIFKIAIPSIAMNAIYPLTISLMNSILVMFSQTAVVVYGIYFKLQSFIFMPMMGLAQGAMPIMGYNYGAGDKKRFKEAVKSSIKAVTVIMLTGTVIYNIFPEKLLLIFNSSEEMIRLGVPAVKTISLGYLFVGINFIIAIMFQSVGEANKSLFMTILRQIIMVVPSAYIFGQIFGINGVWYSYLFAESIACIIFIPIAIKSIKNMKDKTDEAQTNQVA